MTKHIILLGSGGMLGQMVSQYFAKGYDITTIRERCDFTASCPALAAVAEAGDGFVINCIGRIKQKEATRQELYDANAILPAQLVERLKPGQFLVQPSTDCVFSGASKTPYAWNDACDAIDDYGYSKRLGEVALLNKAQATVVRVSIIGPDRSSPQPKGLLGWFLSQPKGAQLKGFSNHFWNGITTLEWCKQVERLVIGNPPSWAGKILQIGTAEHHSKLDMLRMFQDIYGTGFNILPHETIDGINRCLVPMEVTPSLNQQVEELRAYQNA